MEKTIYIYCSIGSGVPNGITASQIMSELDAAKSNPVKIMIDSPGGDIFEGMAIYNAIKNYKGRKAVYIEGLAYGMAFIIALAADEINIHKKAAIGIGKPFIPTISSTHYDKEMKILKEVQKKAEKCMIDIISERLKKSKDEISIMMEKELCFNANEAITQGFAKSIYH